MYKESKLKFKRKVLAITYYGRSGSVFLQSLLDNHPNCITIPGCYIMGIQEWFNKLENNNNNFVINKFCNDYKVFFDPKYINKEPSSTMSKDIGLAHNFHKVGKNQNEKILVDKKKFIFSLKNELNNKKHIKITDLFEAIHVAYAYCLEKKIDNNDWIIFQLHSSTLSRAVFLKQFNTKIIPIIRDPIKSGLSLIKNKFKSSHGENKKLLQFFVNTLNNAKPLIGFEEVTQSIKLEDLHLESKKTMQIVLDWMELPWHDNVLISTFNGKLWYNLADTDHVQGFNKVIINKQHDDLADNYDKAFFTLYFNRLYNEWGYSSSGKSILGFFKPFKMEKDNNIFEIISNRFFLIKNYILNLNFLRIIFRKPYRVYKLLK